MPIALSPVDNRISPYAAERQLVESASRQRRQEFSAGRACAHSVLRALYRDGEPIGMGRGGEPTWPHGVVGSISHAGGLAGAVAARASDTRAVGFDIELLDPPLSPLDERFVLAGAPGAQIGDHSHPLVRYHSKIAFSAKESVFKCLYPRTGWWLELGDVTVAIDLDGGRFTATLGPQFRLPGVDVGALEGRFAAGGSHILTVVCLQ